MSKSQGVEDKLTSAWYSGALWVYLMAPLSLLYFIVISVIKLVHSKPAPSALPVIVVGNLTAGGTGKSPLVSLLVRAFTERGYRVGIVSRGYGVSIPKQTVRMVELDSPASEVGDEPLMLKRLMGCDIALSPQRALAVDALERRGVEIVISDDGLQHHAMHRDIELCVVDGERGFGNGWLLPVGPLRELPKRVQSVDALVLNGSLEPQCSIPEVTHLSEMRLQPSQFIHLSTQETLSVDAFMARFGNASMYAVAGIGNPQRFFRTLAHIGLKPRCQAFPDHYPYSITDFSGISDVIVMTEKDAAKCDHLGLEEAWFLRVEPQLQDNLPDRLYNLLIERGRLSAK